MDLAKAAYEHRFGKEGKRKKARIGNVNAGLMVGLALILDLAQIGILFMLPVENVGFALVPFTWFIAGFAIIAFGFWFGFCGVNYFTGKQAARKLLIVFSSVIVELVPLIDAIPAITASVVAMVLVSRIEDFVGQEKEVRHLTSLGKAALATSVLSGKGVAERDANPRAAERLTRGLGTLAGRTQGMTYENPTNARYGGDRKKYDAAMDLHEPWLRAVRGTNVRDRISTPQKNTQPAQEEEV